jgi:hypothetical protein
MAEREDREKHEKAERDARTKGSDPGTGVDRDLPITGILGFAGGVVGLCAAAALVCWLMFLAVRARLRGEDPPPSPLPAARVQPPPPGPRLQEDPVRDMDLYRVEQQTRLHSYGWADREAGTVRIPIDRAIDLMANHGARAALQEDPRGQDQPAPGEGLILQEAPGAGDVGFGRRRTTGDEERLNRGLNRGGAH